MNYLAFKYSLGSKMRWKKNMKKWPNIMKCISYDSQFIQRVVVFINRSLQSYQQVLSNKRSLMKRLCIKLLLHQKKNTLGQKETKQSVMTCQWKRTIIGITLINKFKCFFHLYECLDNLLGITIQELVRIVTCCQVLYVIPICKIKF